MAMCVRAVACSRTARRLVNRSARSQRPADLQQMMPRVPDGVVLEHELAGARSVGVERERRGAIELLVAERTDRRSRCRAVLFQELERLLLGDTVEAPRVIGVH